MPWLSSVTLACSRPADRLAYQEATCDIHFQALPDFLPCAPSVFLLHMRIFLASALLVHTLLAKWLRVL